ncbi:MAG: glucose-1-phosphate adenylyltransferase [Candidatus Lambdaproteobacteria bacterium]|nr:glucose-1-phosphate adenylyltransferase [Candidatus Lambdaproteobacteria bacterium]
MVNSFDVGFDMNAALRATLALILAGGRGSRLMNLTENQAKPAVPFGGKFRIIDFPLSNCINSGVRRISVVTQYKAHQLIRHVQNGWGFLRGELGEFVELWPAQQQTDAQSWYLGTANSVYQNIAIMREHYPQHVLILAGDHIYRQDYSRLLAQHLKQEADLTVSCIDVSVEAAKGFGVVGAGADGVIEAFVEKPSDPPTIAGRPDRAYASMGIYMFRAKFLYDVLERSAREAGAWDDFGKDVIPGLIARKEGRVIAHRFEDSCVKNPNNAEPYWRDVGTLDAYWEAQMDLVAVTPSLDLYERGWPIWTYHGQRPPAKFVFDHDGRRGIAVDSLVSSGCVISGATVRRSLMSTDAVAHSFSLIEDTVVLPGTHIGRHARLRRAVVDQDCRVPEGLVVGEDPAADAARFYRTDKGVTLITAAMLEKLAG